ncbi:hypothetical protein D7V97_05350 [Corallococcus sp. CA053C]|uniref:hypothetical protein n=1 Tax=Corallococcus sp. CA053C TaxID=2316732 RepID=UPI000EA29BBB|nr:hypothetical protein [Corallococcus sp. CA053C]RKH13524.1 hypothetical protein D7V97_05350 [Corallococcus sp. CA053C]
MKTDNVAGGWARALAVTALFWGFTAMAQTAPPTRVVKTDLVPGAALDTVVASVVDVGVRTGGTVTVTVRLVTAAGVVLAEATGPVTEGLPLRISARAPSTAGVRAEVLLPSDTMPMSIGLLGIERWPQPPATPQFPPILCKLPRAATGDPVSGYPEPTTGEPWAKCSLELRLN